MKYFPVLVSIYNTTKAVLLIFYYTDSEKFKKINVSLKKWAQKSTRSLREYLLVLKQNFKGSSKCLSYV